MQDFTDYHGRLIQDEQAEREHAIEQAIEKARENGKESGKAAGSWFFDPGNSSPTQARRIIQGIEDNDPEILDMLPDTNPLSGEWADGLTEKDVLSEVGVNENDDASEDVLIAFLDGYYEGVREQVIEDANAILAD